MKKKPSLPVLLVVLGIIACLLLYMVDLVRRTTALVLSGKPTPGLTPISTIALTPSSAPTQTAVSTQTSTPIPLQARVWQNVTVHNLHLDVDEIYPNIEATPDEGITETVQRILAEIGVRVAAPEEPADATLTLQVTSHALGSSYVPSGYCYTGASAESQFILASAGRESSSWAAEASCPAPESILSTQCARSPADAPLSCAWKKTVLIGLGDIWGAPILVKVLGEEDAELRAKAAEALGEMGPEALEAIPVLIQAENDPDYIVRKAASEARVRLEEIKKVPSLIQSLKEEDPETRSDAATQLALLGPGASEAVPALTQALQDPNALVRADAAWALEKIGAEALVAVPTLIIALGDEDGWVRTKAGDALRAITGQDFGEDPEGWKRWWEERK